MEHLYLLPPESFKNPVKLWLDELYRNRQIGKAARILTEVEKLTPKRKNPPHSIAYVGYRNKNP